MARRKSNSIEDLLEITALFPWWVGTIIAIVAYVVLHHYAIAELTITPVHGQLGNMVVSQITKVLAGYGQYMFPSIFLLGALSSFLNRKKRKNLALLNQDINSIRSLSWYDFELLVGEAFRMKGYSVTEIGGNGPDGGIDLVLKKDGEIFLVQCKQWKAFKVSVTIVRELFGVMASKGATGGFVVSSGIFTKEAKSFAKGQNIELIDGLELAKMIKNAKSSHLSRSQIETPFQPLVENITEILCPSCGNIMIKRIAKKGQNKGNEFWGCSKYPKCHGVRDNNSN